MRSILTFFKEVTANKTVLLLFTPIITAILSMKLLLIGLLILIFIDLLSGIRKNHHAEGIPFNIFKKRFWLCIKSQLLRQTWKKTYEYGLGIWVMIVFEQLIFGTTVIELSSKAFTLSELAVVIPAIIEVWSIFENFEAVSGNNIMKRLQYLLPSRLRSVLTGEPPVDEGVDEGVDELEK